MIIKLFKQVLEEIRDRADEERLLTEDSIKKRLRERQRQLEAGELTEAEYEEIEEELIERLRAIREKPSGVED